MKPNIICDKHTLLVQVYGCNVVRINGLLTGHGSHYGYHLPLVTMATVITMVTSLHSPYVSPLCSLHAVSFSCVDRFNSVYLFLLFLV